MLVKFRTNLGSMDAKIIKDATGTELELKECQIDCEHDIPEKAAKWLLERGIAEPADKKVKGVAKQPEITAPAK